MARIEVKIAQSRELSAIMRLHHKEELTSGMTSGACEECGGLWPCETYHIAAGWGIFSYDDCLDAGWCEHAGVRF